MKILVTGATGFVGNHVVSELLARNFNVIATSRSKEKACICDWFDSVEYIATDLNVDRSDWFDYLQRPDVLIHLAWEGLPNYNESFHYEKNLPCNFSFLKNMIEGGLKSLAVAGTCLEYGRQEGCLDEELKTNPETAYGIAKDSLRRFLTVFLASYNDFEFNWIRLFYMYGKGQRKNSLLEQLHSSIENADDVFNMSRGEQLRDYLHITEIAKNIIKIALSKKNHGIVNCCSGKPISIRTLVEEEINRLDAKISLNLGFYPYATHEPTAFWGSSKKLSKI